MEGGLNPPFPSIRSKQLQNGWERMGTEGTDAANRGGIRCAAGVAFVTRDLRDVREQLNN